MNDLNAKRKQAKALHEAGVRPNAPAVPYIPEDPAAARRYAAQLRNNGITIENYTPPSDALLSVAKGMDDSAKKWISDSFKSSGKASKYSDSDYDLYLQSRGLPSMSDLPDYVDKYNTYATKANAINTFNTSYGDWKSKFYKDYTDKIVDEEALNKIWTDAVTGFVTDSGAADYFMDGTNIPKDTLDEIINPPSDKISRADLWNDFVNGLNAQVYGNPYGLNYDVDPTDPNATAVSDKNRAAIAGFTDGHIDSGANAKFVPYEDVASIMKRMEAMGYENLTDNDIFNKLTVDQQESVRRYLSELSSSVFNTQDSGTDSNYGVYFDAAGVVKDANYVDDPNKLPNIVRKDGNVIVSNPITKALFDKPSVTMTEEEYSEWSNREREIIRAIPGYSKMTDEEKYNAVVALKRQSSQYDQAHQSSALPAFGLGDNGAAAARDKFRGVSDEDLQAMLEEAQGQTSGGFAAPISNPDEIQAIQAEIDARYEDYLNSIPNRKANGSASVSPLDGASSIPVGMNGNFNLDGVINPADYDDFESGSRPISPKELGIPYSDRNKSALQIGLAGVADALLPGVDVDLSDDDMKYVYYTINYGTSKDVPGGGILSQLTDHERKMFNYIYNHDGASAANKYFNHIKQSLYDRGHEDLKQEIYDATKESPALGVISNIMLGTAGTPLAGIDVADQYLDRVAGGFSDPAGYDDSPLNLSNPLHGGVAIDEATSTALTEGMNPTEAFFARTGLSIGQSAMRMAYGGGNEFAVGALAGAGATGSTAHDIADRGGSADQIFWGSLASGIAEMLFEKFSVGTLVKNFGKGSLRNGIKSIIKNLAIQSGVEGSEELFTEAANILSDTIIMGDKANGAVLYQKYIDSGMSHEEAQSAVKRDLARQIGLAAAGGVLSGLAFGGGSTAVSSVADASQASRVGNSIVSSGTEAVSSLLAEANDLGGESAELAANVNADKPSKVSVGKVAISVARQTQEALGDDLSLYTALERYASKGLVSSTVLSGIRASYSAANGNTEAISAATRSLVADIRHMSLDLTATELSANSRRTTAYNALENTKQRIKKMKAPDSERIAAAQRAVEVYNNAIRSADAEVALSRERARLDISNSYNKTVVPVINSILQNAAARGNMNTTEGGQNGQSGQKADDSRGVGSGEEALASRSELLGEQGNTGNDSGNEQAGLQTSAGPSDATGPQHDASQRDSSHRSRKQKGSRQTRASGYTESAKAGLAKYNEIFGTNLTEAPTPTAYSDILTRVKHITGRDVFFFTGDSVGMFFTNPETGDIFIKAGLPVWLTIFGIGHESLHSNEAALAISDSLVTDTIIDRIRQFTDWHSDATDDASYRAEVACDLFGAWLSSYILCDDTMYNRMHLSDSERSAARAAFAALDDTDLSNAEDTSFAHFLGTVDLSSGRGTFFNVPIGVADAAVSYIKGRIDKGLGVVGPSSARAIIRDGDSFLTEKLNGKYYFSSEQHEALVSAANIALLTGRFTIQQQSKKKSFRVRFYFGDADNLNMFESYVMVDILKRLGPLSTVITASEKFRYQMRRSVFNKYLEDNDNYYDALSAYEKKHAAEIERLASVYEGLKAEATPEKRYEKVVEEFEERRSSIDQNYERQLKELTLDSLGEPLQFRPGELEGIIKEVYKYYDKVMKHLDDELKNRKAEVYSKKVEVDELVAGYSDFRPYLDCHTLVFSPEFFDYYSDCVFANDAFAANGGVLTDVSDTAYTIKLTLNGESRTFQFDRRIADAPYAYGSQQHPMHEIRGLASSLVTPLGGDNTAPDSVASAPHFLLLNEEQQEQLSRELHSPNYSVGLRNAVESLRNGNFDYSVEYKNGRPDVVVITNISNVTMSKAFVVKLSDVINTGNFYFPAFDNVPELHDVTVDNVNDVVPFSTTEAPYIGEDLTGLYIDLRFFDTSFENEAKRNPDHYQIISLSPNEDEDSDIAAIEANTASPSYALAARDERLLSACADIVTETDEETYYSAYDGDLPIFDSEAYSSEPVTINGTIITDAKVDIIASVFSQYIADSTIPGTMTPVKGVYADLQAELYEEFENMYGATVDRVAYEEDSASEKTEKGFGIPDELKAEAESVINTLLSSGRGFEVILQSTSSKAQLVKFYTEALNGTVSEALRKFLSKPLYIPNSMLRLDGKTSGEALDLLYKIGDIENKWAGMTESQLMNNNEYLNYIARTCRVSRKSASRIAQDAVKPSSSQSTVDMSTASVPSQHVSSFRSSTVDNTPIRHFTGTISDRIQYDSRTGNYWTYAVVNGVSTRLSDKNRLALAVKALNASLNSRLASDMESANSASVAAMLIDSGFTIADYVADDKADESVVLAMHRMALESNGVGGLLPTKAVKARANESRNWRDLELGAKLLQFPARVFERMGQLVGRTNRASLVAGRITGSDLKADIWTYHNEQENKGVTYASEAYAVINDACKNPKMSESVAAFLIGTGLVNPGASVYYGNNRVVVFDGGNIYVANANGKLLYAQSVDLDGVAHSFSFTDGGSRAFFDSLVNTKRLSTAVDSSKSERIVSNEGEMSVSVNGRSVSVLLDGRRIAYIPSAKQSDSARVSALTSALSSIYAKTYSDMRVSLAENGCGLLPKIDSYFPSFTGEQTLAAFFNRFDISALPDDILSLGTDLAPVGSLSALLQSLPSSRNVDAIHSFNKFIRTASDVIHITPSVSRMKQLKSALDSVSSEHNNNLKHFNKWFADYIKNITVGVNIGNGTKALNTINKMFALSAVGLNPSVSLSNFINWATAASQTNLVNTVCGLVDTFINLNGKHDTLVQDIPELNRLRNHETAIYTRAFSKVAHRASQVIGAFFWFTDIVSKESTARAKHSEYMKKGYTYEEACTLTNDFLVKQFASRGRGNMPLVFNNPRLKIFTMFQLEPLNMMYQMADIGLDEVMAAVDETIEKNPNFATLEEIAQNVPSTFARSFLKRVLYLLGLTGWEWLMEQLLGRTNSFSPYTLGKGIAEGINAEKNGESFDFASLISDEIIANLPFGNLVVDGGRVPMAGSIENVVDAFAQLGTDNKDASAAEKNSEAWTYADAALGFIPGGSQLSKTYRGIEAVSKGGYYDKSGDRLNYPIAEEDYWKAVLFGPASLAPDDYDFRADALSKSRTDSYNKMVDAAGDDASKNIMDYYYELAKYANTDTPEDIMASIVSSKIPESDYNLAAAALGLELDDPSTPEEESKYKRVDSAHAIMYANRWIEHHAERYRGGDIDANKFAELIEQYQKMIFKITGEWPTRLYEEEK